MPICGLDIVTASGEQTLMDIQNGFDTSQDTCLVGSDVDRSRDDRNTEARERRGLRWLSKLRPGVGNTVETRQARIMMAELTGTLGSSQTAMA
jgi:hypothetical protein